MYRVRRFSARPIDSAPILEEELTAEHLGWLRLPAVPQGDPLGFVPNTPELDSVVGPAVRTACRHRAPRPPAWSSLADCLSRSWSSPSCLASHFRLVNPRHLRGRSTCRPSYPVPATHVVPGRTNPNPQHAAFAAGDGTRRTWRPSDHLQGAAITLSRKPVRICRSLGCPFGLDIQFI